MAKAADSTLISGLEIRISKIEGAGMGLFTTKKKTPLWAHTRENLLILKNVGTIMLLAGTHKMLTLGTKMHPNAVS